MEMKGGGGTIIGYVLGTTIIVPLALYYISLVFYAPNKVTKTAINQYISDSFIIEDSIEEVSMIEYLNSDAKIGGIQTKSYTQYLTKNNTGSRKYYCYGFYSKKYNKYFRLTTLSEGMRTFDHLIEGNVKNIVASVNKDDLNNPLYGTIDNPVPILNFFGVDNSIRNDNKDYDKAYMDTVYYKNVEMYLKFVMPKKEFKARFGK